MQTALRVIGYCEFNALPMTVIEDNHTTIELVKNLKFYCQTKYINICWHIY